MENTLFFLMWMVVTVRTGIKTRCDSPAVPRGERGAITCFFDGDISETKQSIAVYKFEGMGNFKEIFGCQWALSEFHCESEPGYSYTSRNGSSIVLEIRNATEKEVGSYVCQVIPSNPDEVTSCSFTLRDVEDGSANLPDSNRTRTNQNDTHGDEAEGNHTNVIVSVGVTVGVAMCGIVVGLIIFICKKCPFCRQKSSSFSQERETTHVDVHEYLLESTVENTELGGENDSPKVSAQLDQMHIHLRPGVQVEDRNGNKYEAKQRLFHACRTGDVELVKALVDNGTEVNISDTDDDSPLHLAVKYGQRNVVRQLISMGSKVNERNREMYTPLHLASMYPEKTVDARKTLSIQGTDGEEQDGNDVDQNTGGNADSDDNQIMALSEMPEDEPETPESIIHLLLKAKANPESTDNKCHTPLHVACDVHNYTAVKALVDNCAIINAKDSEDVTPLHLACQNGKEDVLMILFAQRDLDIQPKDASLWTPLHYACRYGHTGSAKLLLGAGADINARESRRWTPLHFACDSGNEALVKMLLEHHANTAVTERKAADIEAKENRRWTPLHFACHSGNEACVKLLLEAGASVGVCEERDRTPLHLACESEAEGVVRLLLEAHTDIEATDVNGLRALHVACEKGSDRIVKMLIDRHADKKAQTKDGRKPFNIAKRNGHKKTAKLLTKHRFCV